MRDQNTSIVADPYVELATDIVSAYVANNSIRPGEVVDLLKDLVAVLKSVPSYEAAADSNPVIATKAEIRRSISEDFLISFEDGKKYKTLKRHLTALGMSPEQYREKWGLPSDYPMVAPEYAARRSALAKEIRFGRSAAIPGPRAKTRKTRSRTPS